MGKKLKAERFHFFLQHNLSFEANDNSFVMFSERKRNCLNLLEENLVWRPRLNFLLKQIRSISASAEESQAWIDILNLSFFQPLL